MRKNIIQPSIALVILFALPATLSAWTDPSAAPPSSNASAPVNIGTSDQVKNGGLSLNSLAIFGNTLLSGTTNYLNFGTVAGISGYGLRNNSGVIEFKNSGGSWAVLGNTTLGAMTTGGVLSWGDITNARAGNGYTLLLGSASGGPGPGNYFHPVSFEYSSKDGSGNMTQLAIPYYNAYGTTGDSLWLRSRYSGAWTTWRQILTENANGNVSTAGNITAAGYFHSSDALLKSNIETSPGVSLVEKLRGVTFEWKKTGIQSAGVIAQEVERVLPSAVHTDEKGIKSVEYDQLIAPLIEAVKEQQAEIESLRHEIEILKTNH